MIGSAVNILRRKLKTNTVPEVDERVKYNLFKFNFYLSHIFLAILFLTLGTLTLLDKEAISLSYLWTFFFDFITVGGIGGQISRKI